LILVFTGVVKVIKNLPYVYLSPSLITSMTLIHTFGTILFLLGVLAHLAALIFRVNRPLVKSIFTGEVNLDYIRDRHTHWYEELAKDQGEVKSEGGDEIKEKIECEVKEEKEEETAVADRPAGENLTKEGDQMTMVLKVKGMSCQHCVMSVTKALNKLEGMKNVQVDLAKGEVRFDNTKEIASDRIEKAITDAGYEVVQG